MLKNAYESCVAQDHIDSWHDPDSLATTNIGGANWTFAILEDLPPAHKFPSFTTYLYKGPGTRSGDTLVLTPPIQARVIPTTNAGCSIITEKRKKVHGHQQTQQCSAS